MKLNFKYGNWSKRSLVSAMEERKEEEWGEERKEEEWDKRQKEDRREEREERPGSQ